MSSNNGGNIWFKFISSVYRIYRKHYESKIIIIITSAKVKMESIHLKGSLGTDAFIQYQSVDRRIEIDSFEFNFYTHFDLDLVP